MIKFQYSTWYINVISFIISILVFLFINIFSSHFDFQSRNAILKAGFTVNPKNQNDMEMINSIQESDTKENREWYLEIPSINLKANIQEGTSKEIMEQFVGHFEESKKWAGNVCLAAHNRGYKNNYFSEIKNLKEKDEIIYYFKGSHRKYVVEKNFIIQDTNWSYLEDTEENKITLITCVENEPNYRRCVQATEEKQ